VNQYAASFYGPDALPATNQQYHNNAKKYKFNTKFLIDLLCSKMKNNCRSLADIRSSNQQYNSTRDVASAVYMLRRRGWLSVRHTPELYQNG